MSDTNTETTNTEATATADTQEELSYHAVEKDGKITAIWEMRGRKHVRTIDPRSAEGKHLLGHTDNPETVQNATV
ncbi:MAG TPA: hypothetical protein VFZ34_04380 [Blastocatellia bacterium]|nr:hypothetical protein [Blastocatellia bacterium]